jgi:2-hydroxy-4-(methylsulfanyl)butanoate S-methyltransferase
MRSAQGTYAPVAPAETRRAVAAVAYGFIGSKALFAALEVGLFTALADGPATVDELAAAVAVAPPRLTTLLRTLAALGLVVEDGGRFGNSPAAHRHLVRGARGDLGEYYRLQIGRQIYPALVHLDAGIAGKGAAFDGFGELMASTDDAATFTVAQHAGSLEAARALADRLPLPGAQRLVDVGGGSGAFSIAFCERNPGLQVTLLDFPGVLDVARTYVDAAGLGARITPVPGDAARDPLPGDQDVVLMSYLVSALGADDVDGVLAAAHASLRPGGLLVVHDFLLDDGRPGPTTAALWFLQYLAWQPEALSFTGTELAARLVGAGFAVAPATVLIPDLTKVVLARKGAAS